MLSLEEFNVLVEYERDLGDTAREYLRMSENEYNDTIKSLKEKGFIEGEKDAKLCVITREGKNALEPYRVQRAIFMAAGFGSRMVPLTYTIPKPLVDIKGVRIIETLLDAVVAAGIEEIYIVRGYMGNAFDMLLAKYPNIKFLENPDYNKANNISSAYVMRELMQQAYVLESDLVLANPRVIRKYEYCTNYLGRYTDVTDDWCFKVKDGVVEELLVGGKEVAHMYGISYWNAEDGLKMKSDIENVYHSENGAQKYWDEVSMRDCKDHYQIHVKPVYEGEICEIDTFGELCLVDERYAVNH